MVDFAPAGHGQGISGVLTTVVPGSTIENVRINDRNGLATDVSAARAIASSLRTLPIGSYPNLLINAFGTAACNLDSTAVNSAPLQPVGMEAVVEAVDRFDPFRTGGMLIVASAGNEATTRPNYPAAFPSVLSVGALDGTVDSDGSPWSSLSKTAPVADFSNRGASVDIYALGVDLPTTHVNGYRFEYGADLILGMASVSGTSDAGPTLAAYIAERDVRDGPAGTRRPGHPHRRWQGAAAAVRNDCHRAGQGDRVVVAHRRHHGSGNPRDHHLLTLDRGRPQHRGESPNLRCERRIGDSLQRFA